MKVGVLLKNDIIYDSNIIVNIAIKRRRTNDEKPEKEAELIRNGDRVRKPKGKAKVFKKKEL